MCFLFQFQDIHQYYSSQFEDGFQRIRTKRERKGLGLIKASVHKSSVSIFLFLVSLLLVSDNQVLSFLMILATKPLFNGMKERVKVIGISPPAASQFNIPEHISWLVVLHGSLAWLFLYLNLIFSFIMVNSRATQSLPSIQIKELVLI